MLDDYLELKESIEKETGFALTFEGIHKWIVFVHSKQNNILPVPNRFFGVYNKQNELHCSPRSLSKIFEYFAAIDCAS
jgi:hypothetical protein